MPVLPILFISENLEWIFAGRSVACFLEERVIMQSRARFLSNGLAQFVLISSQQKSINSSTFLSCGAGRSAGCR